MSFLLTIASVLLAKYVVMTKIYQQFGGQEPYLLQSYNDYAAIILKLFNLQLPISFSWI